MVYAFYKWIYKALSKRLPDNLDSVLAYIEDATALETWIHDYFCLWIRYLVW